MLSRRFTWSKCDSIFSVYSSARSYGIFANEMIHLYGHRDSIVFTVLFRLHENSSFMVFSKDYMDQNRNGGGDDYEQDIEVVELTEQLNYVKKYCFHLHQRISAKTLHLVDGTYTRNTSNSLA